MDARGQRQPKRWTEDEDSILYKEAVKQGTYSTTIPSDWHSRRQSCPMCGRWRCCIRAGGRSYMRKLSTFTHRLLAAVCTGTCIELTHCPADTASLGPVKDWHRIAAKIPNRTNKDCRKRWINKVRGGLKSGPWSEAEDQKLRDAVEKYGQRWTVISQEFGSRSSDQCAKRWQYTLDPKLEHREWTSGEDHLLLELVQKFGHDWKFICYQHYPTRSRNDVKNRYTILSRRLASGAAETGAADEDFQDDTCLSGEDLLEGFNPLDASELGNQSSAALGISLHEEFGFNLLDDPGCEDVTTSGSISSPFFDSSSAYQASSSGGFVETDEPSWIFSSMANTTDATPSTYDGSHGSDPCGSGSQAFANSLILDIDSHTDLDLSQVFSSLDCPPGVIKCIEKLDVSSASPLATGDGDSDPQSPSFKVVLMADKCDHELVKYLIDVTKPIQGRVKMKVVM